MSAQCRSSSRSTTGHDRDAFASKRARGLEEAKALALRVVAGRLGEVRDSPSKLGNEAGELAPVRADLVPKHLRRRRRDVPTERLDERLVGDQHLLLTAAEENGGALLTSGAAELARQPRLADARIAGDDREPTRSTPSVGPLVPKPANRVLPADERAVLSPRQRRRQRRQRLGGRPDRSGVMRVNGLEQPAGLSRGRHVQLRAKAASEIVEGQARCGGLSRGDQTANQLAVRVLSKRIELDAAT